MDTFFAGAAIALIGVGAVWFWLKQKRDKPTRDLQIFSSVEQLRAIGQLSVYKARTKEIVTATDHSWGELGERYLRWALSSKKMVMIFEFEIDFSYNLQDPLFEIKEASEGAWTITMPPCERHVRMRNLRFYDEQGSKFLPWLLPGLLNGFLRDGFSEEAKNQLVDAARLRAEGQAVELIDDLQPDVQKSAVSTLGSISRAFGSAKVDFAFTPQASDEITVTIAEKRAAS